MGNAIIAMKNMRERENVQPVKLPDTARNNANKKIGIHIRNNVKCGKRL